MSTYNYGSLSQIEKNVYSLIQSGRFTIHDIPLIAEHCRISQTEVHVAIQLLTIKKILINEASHDEMTNA